MAWRIRAQKVRLREETLFMKRSFYLCKFLSVWLKWAPLAHSSVNVKRGCWPCIGYKWTKMEAFANQTNSFWNQDWMSLLIKMGLFYSHKWPFLFSFYFSFSQKLVWFLPSKNPSVVATIQFSPWFKRLCHVEFFFEGFSSFEVSGSGGGIHSYYCTEKAGFQDYPSQKSWGIARRTLPAL